VIVVCPGCITLEADSERLAETLDALNESRGKIIKLEAQMEELTRKLECPTSDEIIVAIESLEERKEKDYIYQRERAAQAEAEVERLRRERTLQDWIMLDGKGEK
jgi:hypothetical protein